MQRNWLSWTFAIPYLQASVRSSRINLIVLCRHAAQNVVVFVECTCLAFQAVYFPKLVVLHSHSHEFLFINPVHSNNDFTTSLLVFEQFSCLLVPQENIVIVIEASCNYVCTVTNYGRYTFSCAFEITNFLWSLTFLIIFIFPSVNNWFVSHLTRVNHPFVFFVLVKTNDIIGVFVKE